MVDYSHFYMGSDNGLDPEYGNPINHYVPTANIGTAINPTTANQLNETARALNTGATTIEVQMTMADVEKAIPNQHLEEINRLRKLVGADLTLHGPMIEPTGINPQGGTWDATKRKQAEEQMWTALERGKKINPDESVVVTFHSSHGLPEPRTTIIDKNGKKITTDIAVVDERSGRVGQLPLKAGKDYFKDKVTNIDEELERFNQDDWQRKLSNLGIESSRARDSLGAARRQGENTKSLIKPMELYKVSKTKVGQEMIKSQDENTQEIAENIIDHMEYSKIVAQDAYTNLNNLYNEAYDAAKNSNDNKSKETLDKLRNDIKPLMNKYEKDPDDLQVLIDMVTKGVQGLNSIKSPQVYRPLEGFAIKQASETFSNLALKGFNKFKDKAPIISIENPPAGSGITRAEDLKKLVDESQRKFVDKAVSSGKLSRKEAEKQADKLIGITWDVGHINMLRKFGYDTEKLKEQTKIVAPNIKHVHLSDNFGFEHSELPMGMGNVPIEEHEKLIKGYSKQVNKIKRIIEAGDWVQHFQGAPAFIPTLEAYGSPIYSMRMSPYWNQISNTQGGYYTGLGQTLPDINFQTYGTTFSNLPVELGGQMQGRNRLSGSPME